MQEFKKVKIYNPRNFDGIQKIVQLYFKKEPHLLYGGSFHYKILEGFLEEHNLEFEIVQAPGVTFSCLVPALEGPDYQVVGTGFGALYFRKKLYTGLEGSSRDYDIGIDEWHEGLFRKTLMAESWTCL